MAFKQTDLAKGYYAAAQPPAVGSLHTLRIHLDLTAAAFGGIATDDIVELGVLPMHCRLRGVTVIPAALGAGITVDVGIMSGNPGDTSPTRTVGNEIFDGQALNATPVNGAAASMYNLAPVARDRSIGLIAEAAITAGAGKSITVLVDYWQL